MSIDRATVQKIAHLARIEVPAEEEEKLASQLSGIMKFVEQLNEVDTAGVVPMTTAAKVKLPYRKDEVSDGGYAADLLANAPDNVDDEYFAVPKVVE